MGFRLDGGSQVLVFGVICRNTGILSTLDISSLGDIGVYTPLTYIHGFRGPEGV